MLLVDSKRVETYLPGKNRGTDVKSGLVDPVQEGESGAEDIASTYVRCRMCGR